MKFWYSTLVFLLLIAVTAITPRDSFLGYFFAGFWGVIGTAVAFLVLLCLIMSDNKK